jgi:chromosome segregation ATPase
MSEAEAIDSDDAATLTSLVQSADFESDEETGAPSAASYKGQSGQIVETLMNLLEKTQKQLQNARTGEKNAVNGYQMLKQSLDAKIKTLSREMGEAKKSKAATGETWAVAKGNLDLTKKDHSEDEKELAQLHHECLDQANSFEEGMASRAEELKALAEAKKIISSTTGGATKQTYELAQASFVQVASKSQSSGSSQAMHIVRKIAITYKSNAFMELANHIEKAIRYSGLNGGSPFNKVKSMLSSMIDKLQKEGESAATKKEYCDKEMGETTSNLDDKELQIERLTTQLEVMSAASKTLRSEVGGLQKQLGEIAVTQAEMNKLRMEEKATYEENRPVLEQGLEGIKSALGVLRDYYAQDADSSSGGGAATGIIGMLEVVETDFSKSIAAMIASEESAASEYATATKENKVSAAAKRQDVKYKTAEYVSLDNSIAESRSDRAGVNSELAAVKDYFAGIKKECVAAPSSYEQRKKRREAELGGLQEALESIGEASSFLQTGSQHRTLRGVANVM